MRKDYGERYRDLYERHWWWRARERAILNVLRSRQPAQGWKRLLDVGCGDALFFDELAHFGEVEGVEPEESLISPDSPHRARIHVGSFDRTAQLAGEFSVVLMLDVLEHLADPVAALRYALELLAPDGILLATVPAFNSLWTNHDVVNQHYTRFTKRSFRKLADNAGLRIEEERYFFHWLFPVKFVARVAEWAVESKPTPARVPAQSINRLLYLLSRLEEMTWGRISLPFGSSLMVIGRKSAL